jgi:hypothetical protein
MLSEQAGRRVSVPLTTSRHPLVERRAEQLALSLIRSNGEQFDLSRDAGPALSRDCGEEVIASAAAAAEVVWRPERVERTRPTSVQPQPRLPLPAPVQQADRTRVQPPALPRHVVAAEPVLVPAVLHGLHLAGEHQQERRERAQLVNPGLLLLHLHPVFQLRSVPAGAPPVEVDDHDPGVEVARRPRPVREDGGVLRVLPERVGEVGGEVGVAVLGAARAASGPRSVTQRWATSSTTRRSESR